MNVLPTFALEDNSIVLNIYEMKAGDEYFEYTNDEKTEFVKVEVLEYISDNTTNSNARIAYEDPWSGSMPYGTWTLQINKGSINELYNIGYKVDVKHYESGGTAYSQILSIYSSYTDFKLLNVKDKECKMIREISTTSSPAMCEMSWEVDNNISGTVIFNESGYLNTKFNYLGQYQVSWRL